MDKGKIPTPVWLLASVAVLALVILAVARFGPSLSEKLGPEYSYDIEQYAQVDPSLILYKQAGPLIETGLEQSRAIAADAAGTIYVVGDKKIAMWHDAGRETIDLPGEPTCIMLDRDGAIVVGLTDHLVFLNDDGAIQYEWKAPAANALLTSLAADTENVYAADAVNKVVWRFNRQGVVVNRIGARETKRDIPGLIVPSPYFDIAMYPDGLLRVVNPGRHWIEAYTPNGDREWHWGKASIKVEGFSGCCNPVALAILPDGSFVTCEKGLVRVKVYDAEGEFVGLVAGPEQLGQTQPMRVCRSPEECGKQGFDVAVDAAGRICVLDTLQNTVRIFEKN